MDKVVGVAIGCFWEKILSASDDRNWPAKRPSTIAPARLVNFIELNGEPRLLLNNTLRAWATLSVTVRSPAS